MSDYTYPWWQVISRKIKSTALLEVELPWSSFNDDWTQTTSPKLHIPHFGYSTEKNSLPQWFLDKYTFLRKNIETVHQKKNTSSLNHPSLERELLVSCVFCESLCWDLHEFKVCSKPTHGDYRHFEKCPPLDTEMSVPAKFMWKPLSELTNHCYLKGFVGWARESARVEKC